MLRCGQPLTVARRRRLQKLQAEGMGASAIMKTLQNSADAKI